MGEGHEAGMLEDQEVKHFPHRQQGVPTAEAISASPHLDSQCSDSVLWRQIGGYGPWKKGAQGPKDTWRLVQSGWIYRGQKKKWKKNPGAMNAWPARAAEKQSQPAQSHTPLSARLHMAESSWLHSQEAPRIPDKGSGSSTVLLIPSESNIYTCLNVPVRLQLPAPAQELRLYPFGHHHSSHMAPLVWSQGPTWPNRPAALPPLLLLSIWSSAFIFCL